MMLSLEQFPPLPSPGMLTLCEVEGTVHSVQAECANVEVFTNAISAYPSISITRELLHHTPASRDEMGRIFLPGEEAFLKRLVSAWYESGFSDAVHTVAAMRETEAPKAALFCANLIVKFINVANSIRNKFHPHLRASGEKLITAVSQTREWPLSPVRCLEWHPHTTKLAVGAWDDSVRIYSKDSQLIPILKCKNQASVSCLAWRPFSASELAVGSETGVFLWNIDPTSLVTRPSVSCARILKKPGHSPVTGVSWNPQGNVLLTASAADASMYLWEVEMERQVALRRVGGGGVCLTTWSPDSSKIFAATSGIIFRVWDTNMCTPDRWNLISGRVQSACWSPCGSVVLFASTEEPIIYSLAFNALGSVFQSDELRVAKPVIDLTPVEVEGIERERVGGIVTSLAWDKRGHHLAVMFKESSIIAVFRTEIRTILSITPCCFINGLPGEMPNAINFQKNFEEGAVLSIAWSTGRIQHFPFVYTDLTPDEDLSNSLRRVPCPRTPGMDSRFQPYSPVSPIQRTSPFTPVSPSAFNYY